MNEIGQKLKASIRAGRAMHGYIITGGDADAAEKLMLECAALLLFGTEETEMLPFSPDYAMLDGSIKVDDVRDIRREVSKATYSSINRVYVIKNAHLMNASSINAMLKLLEEPPEGTYFFMSGIEQRVLPTIRSRCMIIRLGSGDIKRVRRELEALGASETDALNYVAYADANLDAASRLFEDEGFRELRKGSIEALIAMLKKELPFGFFKKIEKDRNAVTSSIDFMLFACNDMLALKSGVSGIVQLNAADYESQLRTIANEFGFRSIFEISTRLTEAAERFASSTTPGQILDRLVADINTIATKRKA